MIIIAGLLTVALLGAVLSSVGGERPAWVSAPDETNAPPSREIIGGVKSVGDSFLVTEACRACCRAYLFYRHRNDFAVSDLQSHLAALQTLRLTPK
jgi:hypothetical protein